MFGDFVIVQVQFRYFSYSRFPVLVFFIS